MTGIAFSMGEFIELVERKQQKRYPYLGYAIYDVPCPSCGGLTAVGAMVGELRNVRCIYCGFLFPILCRFGNNHDGGGLQPVGVRHNLNANNFSKPG